MIIAEFPIFRRFRLASASQVACPCLFYSSALQRLVYYSLTTCLLIHCFRPGLVITTDFIYFINFFFGQNSSSMYYACGFLSRSGQFIHFNSIKLYAIASSVVEYMYPTGCFQELFKVNKQGMLFY